MTLLIRVIIAFYEILKHERMSGGKKTNYSMGFSRWFDEFFSASYFPFEIETNLARQMK